MISVGRGFGLAVAAAFSLMACGRAATAQPSVTPSSAAECRPTDQDRYVYHPDRLAVQAPCIRVTGTVVAARPEPDGDLHIRVQLDPEYSRLLTPGNQHQCARGVCDLLVVEPVCVGPVTQADAISMCASDTNKLTSLPPFGVRVWLEGRYVLDLDHDSWGELHPLYRWGVS